MKPALSGLVMLLLFTTLSAQTFRTSDVPDIPAPVMNKFTLLYPDASNISWVVQDDKYLAEFKNEKVPTSILLQQDGQVLQSETRIKVIALPPNATSFLVDEIKVKKIDDATIIESEPGVITFKAIAGDEEFRFDGMGHIMGHPEWASVQGDN